MSNLAVVNFSVGGTLTVSGKITLAETVLSSSTASFQGLSTTSLTTTGTSTFNGSLPTSTKTPTLDSQLTTKIYVDTADTTLNTRIMDNDTSVRTYIDASYNELNTRITKTDADQKTYIDNQISDIKVKPIFYVFQSVTSTQSVPNNAMTKVRYFENVYNVFGRYTNSE